MQYCDALDESDLADFGIGQPMCAGFFRRPVSLELLVRGKDEELWWKAVGNLREALRLRPDNALVKADLGMAYLLQPVGRDLGVAARFLDEAAQAAEKDETLGSP